MGFFMFSKFLFRIQKIIFQIIKDRPASTLSLLVMQNAFGNVSDITDTLLNPTNIINRAGFFLGPLDSATELSGLNLASELVGY